MLFKSTITSKELSRKINNTLNVFTKVREELQEHIKAADDQDAALESKKKTIIEEQTALKASKAIAEENLKLIPEFKTLEK